MARVNRFCATGYLGKDPEVKYSATGMAICKVNVAISNDRKIGSTWEKRTLWMPLVFFKEQAEKIYQDFAKGDMIYFEGRLDMNEWEDKEKNKHKDVQCMPFVVLKCERPPRSTNAPARPEKDFPPEEDIPF